MRHCIVLVLTVAGLLGNALTAAQVTVAWDASTDPTVVGYRVYYGGASGAYTNIVAAGSGTSVTISNLLNGATYYFAATAYTVEGLESPFSLQLVYGVGGAPCTVSLSNLAQTYDGTPKPVEVVTSPSDLAVATTYNELSSPPSAAGTYQVIAQVTASNYEGKATNTLIISKATAAIQLAGLSQSYDGTDKVAVATTTPSGLSVSLTYNGGTSSPVSAGSYQVIATINNANYTGSSTNMLVVSKGIATIQLANLAQIYNGMARSASAITTPTGLAIGLTYTGSPAAPTNAGSYALSASINDPNYSGTTSNLLVVAKAGATVQWANLSQTYDGTAKSASVNTAPSALAVALTYNALTAPPTAVGNYQVVALISSLNYTGGSTNTLAITKANGILQLANLSQTYDGRAKAVSVTTTPPGLSFSLSYNGVSAVPTNAGNYVVVGAIWDPNYSGFISNTLSIAKGQATVQLANLSQTYDGKAKAASVTTTPAGMAASLTYDGLPNAPTNAGNYRVIASIADANCTGTTTNTLYVSKAPGIIQFGNLNQSFDGSSKSVSTTTVPVGLAVSLTFNGSAGSPSNAGVYGVVATINDANYAGSGSDVLTITKSTGTVQLGMLNQIYDGNPKSVSATTTPAGLNVLMTYNGQSQAPSHAGSYSVIGTINDVNYDGGATNTLTVSKSNQGYSLRTAIGLNTPQRAVIRADSTTDASAVPQILLSWAPVTNAVSVLESTDLGSWMLFTNISGTSGQLSIPQEDGPHFYVLTAINPTNSTNSTPTP